MIIINLNINSFPNKFDDLKLLLIGVLDFFTITETKLDNIFPVSHFHIDKYSEPYILYRNRNGGGIIIYIRENLDVDKTQLTK